MGMVMLLKFKTSGTVFFTWWNFNSVSGLVGSMIAIYLIALCYEGFKLFRTYVKLRMQSPTNDSVTFTKATITNKSHLIQALFQGVQVFLSYILMLVFMTYNAWLCIAAIWGLVTGYFVFGRYSTTRAKECS
ncbi:hypothetical protein GWI33_004426 [Rhynchophorus ferrugineus]|uniref:Copper transport protein n=1 Tax=Rhynchophorus ferrugineus TaxID=354439 RepID=A0A834IIX6_RHYFE|nr:hypothetical protein GWI33_004426 [Rhynchophorus ferrugineus]